MKKNKRNKKTDSLGRPVTVLVGGQRLVNVHSADICVGDFCTIHNNSDHHMKDWPQNWRPDRGIMERICEHGVGHIDPDHPLGNDSGVHGCCGCCVPPNPFDEHTRLWEDEF